MSEIPEPDPSLSRDATHSSYDPATDVPETNPPSGASVVQTLGKPGLIQNEPTAKTTTKTSSTSSS